MQEEISDFDRTRIVSYTFSNKVVKWLIFFIWGFHKIRWFVLVKGSKKLLWIINDRKNCSIFQLHELLQVELTSGMSSIPWRECYIRWICELENIWKLHILQLDMLLTICGKLKSTRGFTKIAKYDFYDWIGQQWQWYKSREETRTSTTVN